ncbi:hypothetical protein BKA70DRAFT_1435714 [Coprinopsis sp. MPI-PUGE-AT-0042]|nr:hypothetical protein BKA70DRAFT_1435714 [Coprinopsis sp. MPI-PUGE-AT-0042]
MSSPFALDDWVLRWCHGPRSWSTETLYKWSADETPVVSPPPSPPAHAIPLTGPLDPTVPFFAPAAPWAPILRIATSTSPSPSPSPPLPPLPPVLPETPQDSRPSGLQRMVQWAKKGGSGKAAEGKAGIDHHSRKLQKLSHRVQSKKPVLVVRASPFEDSSSDRSVRFTLPGHPVIAPVRVACLSEDSSNGEQDSTISSSDLSFEEQETPRRKSSDAAKVVDLSKSTDKQTPSAGSTSMQANSVGYSKARMIEGSTEERPPRNTFNSYNEPQTQPKLVSSSSQRGKRISGQKSPSRPVRHGESPPSSFIAFSPCLVSVYTLPQRPKSRSFQLWMPSLAVYSLATYYGLSSNVYADNAIAARHGFP